MDPRTIFFEPHQKKKILTTQKYIYIYLDPTIELFLSLHCNGDTICIGQEIQCLPCTEFFLAQFGAKSFPL